MSRGDYEERAARNDESRTKASQHAEPWTGEELDFLLTEWNDGSEETLAIVAEILGRTIEACRQRFYEGRRGHIRVRTETTVTTVVRGWLVGYCFECGRFGDVYSDGNVSRCEDCQG